MSYTSQNKILPGVYTNFTTTLGAFVPGKRGTVALPAVLSWGEPGKVFAVQDTTVKAKLGYAITAVEMAPVAAILQKASTVLLYRLNTGVKARYAAEDSGVKLEAAWGGSRGDAITVQIAGSVGAYTVTTLLDGMTVDVQDITGVEDFHGAGWVAFQEGSTLEVGIYPLAGGSDGLEDEGALEKALEDYLLWEFDTICGWGITKEGQEKLITFVGRAALEERRVQCVVEDKQADHENVLSIRQSFLKGDGTPWPKDVTCAWLAGATAGAKMTESNTFGLVDGIQDISPRYTKAMQEQGVLEGQCVFDVAGDGVRLVYDINTLVHFNEAHPKSFRKNKIVRVLYTADRDIKTILRREFLGKVPNSADGRSQVKGRLTEYLMEVQRQGAIEGFDAATDLTVRAGEDVDAICVDYAIQPVDTGDKYYLSAQVR